MGRGVNLESPVQVKERLQRYVNHLALGVRIFEKGKKRHRPSPCTKRLHCHCTLTPGPGARAISTSSALEVNQCMWGHSGRDLPDPPPAPQIRVLWFLAGTKKFAGQDWHTHPQPQADTSQLPDPGWLAGACRDQAGRLRSPTPTPTQPTRPPTSPDASQAPTRLPPEAESRVEVAKDP